MVKRSARILVGVLAMLLCALSLSWAQGGRRGGGGGGGGGLSAEQLLGHLALSPDILLTDEQLVNVRNALRASYAEQLNMREAMRGGSIDMREMQNTMADMRKSMLAAVGKVLSREQVARMRVGIDQMSGRGRGGGRR